MVSFRTDEILTNSSYGVSASRFCHSSEPVSLSVCKRGSALSSSFEDRLRMWASAQILVLSCQESLEW